MSTDHDYVELTVADLAYRWRARTVLECARDTASEPAGEEYATTDTALRWLLQVAWADLQSARRSALNGQWSMDCDAQVARIVGLTKLTGPLSWEHVSVDLILDGLYEQIHEAMDMPTPLTDDDRRRAQDVMDARLR